MKILRRNVDKQELKDFLYYGMNLEDKELYETLNKSQANVFQFAGSVAAGMVQRAKPSNFDELTACNALSRPGSSFSFDDYCANGTTHSKYPETISKYLKDTHGCILFQEQIMRIVEDLSHKKIKGDYCRKLLKSLGKANKKKEDLDKWDNLVSTIKQESSGILKENEIKDFTNDLLVLSQYSFNKSHASCYSAVACMTLYMMTYFRSYYWAASLTYDATKLDVLKDSIKNANKDGFKIIPPDINTSNIHFTPFTDKIGFGLNDIKGVGEQPALDIIEHRPYSSPIDFICKTFGTSINKRVTTALINSGAMDSIIGGEEHRRFYSDVIEKFYEKKKTTKVIPLLVEKWEDSLKEVLEIKTTGEWIMQMEEQYLGGQFFHNKFSIIDDKIETLYKKGYCLRDFEEVKQKNLNKQYVFVYLSGWRVIQDKNGNDMAFAIIEDRNGEKYSVPIFHSYYQYCKVKYFGEGFYLLDVYPTEDGKIMFGSRSWVRDAKTITNMMAKVPNV